MSKSNALETAWLKLYFQNIDITGVGDAGGLRGSVAAGQLWVSFHTGDPGEAGSQAANEVAYTGYARRPLNRGTVDFDVTGNVLSIVPNVDFPEMTGGAGGTITHWSIGPASSGATVVAYKGACTPSIIAALGSIPRLKGMASGTPTTITED